MEDTGILSTSQFQKKKLEQINQVRPIMGTSGNSFRDVHLEASFAPLDKVFNASQQSFRSSVLDDDLSSQKPHKLNPLQKRPLDESTQMNSDYQQLTSLMQPDDEEPPQENREQILKLNNFFEEVQKQKSNKIKEL